MLSCLTATPFASWSLCYVCLIYKGDWRSLSVGGWQPGVLCQHSFGSPRLLLLLLPPLASVGSMSCDRQLDQSPLWSKACWRMCSHAYSIAKRNVSWCSGRDKRVSAMCEVFCLNLLSFCDVFVKWSHHHWRFSLSWGLRICQTPSKMLKLTLRYLSLLWLEALVHTTQARKRLLWFSHLPPLISLDLFLYSQLAALSRSQAAW